MPDSGIDPEDDVASLASDFPSTQEYLTSLGVTDGGGSYLCPTRHHDIDKIVARGRLEAADLADAAEDPELKELIYSKVSEVLAEDGDGAGRQNLPDFLPSPSPGSPIPAIMNRSLVGGTHQRASPATPAYQPLTQVFSEIAKLKNGSTARAAPPASLDLAGGGRRQTSHYHASPVIAASTPSAWGAPTFHSPASPNSNNNNNDKKFTLRQSESEVEIKI